MIASQQQTWERKPGTRPNGPLKASLASNDRLAAPRQIPPDVRVETMFVTMCSKPDMRRGNRAGSGISRADFETSPVIQPGFNVMGAN